MALVYEERAPCPLPSTESEHLPSTPWHTKRPDPGRLLQSTPKGWRRAQTHDLTWAWKEREEHQRTLLRWRPCETDRGCLLVRLHPDQMFRLTEFGAIFSELLHKLSLMLIGLRLKRRERLSVVTKHWFKRAERARLAAYAPQTTSLPGRPSPASAPWNPPDHPALLRLPCSVSRCLRLPYGHHAICKLGPANPSTSQSSSRRHCSLSGLTACLHCAKNVLSHARERNRLAFWCALLATA